MKSHCLHLSAIQSRSNNINIRLAGKQRLYENVKYRCIELHDLILCARGYCLFIKFFMNSNIGAANVDIKDEEEAFHSGIIYYSHILCFTDYKLLHHESPNDMSHLSKRKSAMRIAKLWCIANMIKLNASNYWNSSKLSWGALICCWYHGSLREFEVQIEFGACLEDLWWLWKCIKFSRLLPALQAWSFRVSRTDFFFYQKPHFWCIGVLIKVVSVAMIDSIICSARSKFRMCNCPWIFQLDSVCLGDIRELDAKLSIFFQSCQAFQIFKFAKGSIRAYGDGEIRFDWKAALDFVPHWSAHLPMHMCWRLLV